MHFLPSVARLVKTHSLKLDGIKATGPKGHYLKGDLLSLLIKSERQPNNLTRPSTSVVKVVAGDQLDSFVRFSKDDPVTWMRRCVGVACSIRNYDLKKLQLEINQPSRTTGSNYIHIVYTPDSKSAMVSGSGEVEPIIDTILRILQHPEMLHL